MVREKKEKCCRTFCEEHECKDSWEVVRWAKDPWRLKTRMRNLRDLEGTTLGTDGQKAEGLVRDLFGWNEESEGEGPQESVEYGQDEIQDMEERVRRALMRPRIHLHRDRTASAIS